MPLKQLVLNGFKSFADKTTINFNKGITGIVGPNGSGKSNVTEAIRWVMGENSAKALRGENMRDIIFAGSEFRGPLNKAEVCLIFDNHDRQLHLDSDKVAIMRRILRSGDSEYFINNQSVRLKDIRTLFVDSGLSQNSLAIISQGKVDQILNSQAEDRRYIFEEAAGVLHFKQQKLVALKKLDETNNNLIRINDLVKELKARVEPLSEESSLAKQYKFEKKQLDRKLKQLLALEIESLVLEKKEIGSKLSDSKTNLDRIDEEVSRSQKDLEAKKKKSKLLHEQKDDHQSALLHITQEIAQLSTELQIQKQSFEYDAATAKEFEQQHQELIVRKNKLQQIVISQQNDLAQVTNNAQQLADFKKKLGSKLNITPNELNRNLELVRSDYIQTLQDQTTNNNQQVFLKNEIQRLTRAEDSQVVSLSEQVQQSSVKLHQLLQDKKNLTQQHEELAAKNNQKTKEYNLISQHGQKLQEQINHLQNILSQKQAQIDGLKKLQQRHDGYYTGVKFILNNMNKFAGAIGVVGDLLNFSPKLEAALITSLGSGVQSVVTIDKNSAKDAVELLKKYRAGRVTFLPLGGLRKNKIPDSTLRVIKSMDKVLGVAEELVTPTIDKDISEVINYLLGNVIIVEDMQTALQVQSKTGGYYRIVTLDGDIISPGGSITGGIRNQRTNSPLQINLQIAELEDKVVVDLQQMKSLRQELSQFNDKIHQFDITIQEYQRQLLTLESEFNKSNLDYQGQKKENDRLNQLLLLQTNAQKQKQNDIEKIKRQLVEQETLQKVIADKLVSQKSKMESLKREITQFDNDRQHLQAELADNSSRLAVANNKCANLQEQIKQNQEQALLVEKQLQSLAIKMHDLDAKKNNTQNEENLNQKIAMKKASQEKLTADLTELNTQLGKIDAELNQLESRASRDYELRKNLADNHKKLSIDITKLSDSIRHKLDILSQDYDISYEAALDMVEGEHNLQKQQDLAKDVKLHKMSIAEIGPVNLNAIDEYQEVKTRYDFLSEQQNDLLSARKNIEVSMSKLDNEVKKRFEDTFLKIAQKFKTIFPIMFGGGHAQLMMVDPKNILETGIEIVAQPPGKKLQSLSLLSGGERALTAITLLFAMLEVSPVPFCILDEVEAALDEANVVRFADFLNKYELQTQFIVITHRRGTMKKVNNLYGVVMQESGVSQVLSVSLTDDQNR